MKSIKKYLKAVSRKERTGRSGEASYYGVFEELMREVIGSERMKEFEIIPQPIATEAGIPDFIITTELGEVLGAIETKLPGENLSRIANTPQIRKYQNKYQNFILTDFYEFWLYYDGVRIGTTSLQNKSLNVEVDRDEEIIDLFRRFLSLKVKAETEVDRLSKILAREATTLKEQLHIHFAEEGEAGVLHQSYADFRNELIHSLEVGDFIDMYAQTVVYGLLTIELNVAEDKFGGRDFLSKIPKGFGVLRAVFDFILHEGYTDEVKATFDRIEKILKQSHPIDCFRAYYAEDGIKDPFMHFYETFLRAYNYDESKAKGVYYTPLPIVSYITRSVDTVLRDTLGADSGFAEDHVHVLDPAAGTLSFMSSAAEIAIEREDRVNGDGGLDYFIKNHVLKHFYGFELMMTPYVIGHLKMLFSLGEHGYTMDDDDGFRLYLTNTLEVNIDEMAEKIPEVQKHLQTYNTKVGVALNKEAHCANKVRAKKPILAIIGNPPYQRCSENGTKFTRKVMPDYKKNIGDVQLQSALSDDYIKFIRFAQWKVDHQGQGVIGFITNNSYIDGLVHKGMRKCLMDSFDEIYVLNLHGNARTEKKTPYGGRDENVFGIKPGVAITFFIKHGNKHESTKVYYKDVWGTMKEKFNYLRGVDIDGFAEIGGIGGRDIRTTDWTEVTPCEPDYFFDDRDFSLQPEYDQGVSTSDIFKEHSTGIATGRDGLTIQKTRADILGVVKKFAALTIDAARNEFGLRKDSRDWTIKGARNDIRAHKPPEKHIKQILYRPFDMRHTYYTGEGKGFISVPCYKIMQHMLEIEGNVGLFTCRNGRLDGSDNIWNSVYCTDGIGDSHIFYRSGSILHPLYTHSKYKGKQPNITDETFTMLEESYGTIPTSEDVFYYIYGILHSNIYREKYNEFLKIAFPKIPFTKNHNLFLKIGVIGKQLADLHLMKPDVFNTSKIKYHGRGDDKVEKISYDEEKHRVVINKNKYFEPVSKEVWEYQIGGYTVMQKWLKDRRLDVLTTDDVNHYEYIGEALGKTIELQDEVDELYDEVESSGIINISREDVESQMTVTKSLQKLNRGR
jgi:predicted helicase